MSHSLPTTFLLVILLILERCIMLKNVQSFEKRKDRIGKMKKEAWNLFQCTSGVCARDCTLL